MHRHYYTDRTFIVLGENEKAAALLEKRILENKKIALQKPQFSDAVSDLLENDFLAWIKDAPVNYTFFEIRHYGHQISGFYLNLLEDATYKIYYYEDEPQQQFDKSTFRINNIPDLSRFKREYYDERYGLITNIYKYLDSFNIALVGCEFSYQNEVNFAFGRAEDFSLAETGALLELLERRSMCDVPGEQCYLCYENNKNCLTDPRPFLYYDYQHADIPQFDEKTRYYWLKVLNYKKQIYEYLPLQFFDIYSEDQHKFVLETSNGVALGGSVYEARLFALLELIERDSFLLFWYGKVKVYEIDRYSIPDKERETIERYEKKDRKVYLFDLTFDTQVPVILCLVVSTSDKMSTYISTAAHINPLIALRNAINECLVGHKVYSRNNNMGEKNYKDSFDVVEMGDHIDFSSRREFIKSYSFIINDNEKKTFGELYRNNEFTRFENAKELLHYIVNERLSDQKDIYFADLTSELSYRYNLYISKVIAPQMLTMTFGHKYRRINGQRIDNGIGNSQYHNRRLMKRGEINECAHPFP